jgi:hypothetical protein
VYRMELGLKKDPNRRFVIKNDSPETTSDLWNINYEVLCIQ